MSKWCASGSPTQLLASSAVDSQRPTCRHGQQTSEIAWLDNAGSTHVEAKEPHEQCRRMAIVVHIVTAEVACHAGGRGFESGCSRL